MSDRLTVTQYTDPMCIWCYALDPVIRKVSYVLGDRAEVHNVMGLLVGDVRGIIGDDRLSAMRFAKLKTDMGAHFRDAARRGGIPVTVEHLGTARPEDVTSVPASMAFEAVRMQDEETANRFLRRVREAFHSDGMNITNDPGALRGIAGTFGIDLDAYDLAMSSGEAAALLEADIARCRSEGIRSFPTLRLEYGGRAVTISGYVGYGFLRDEILRLTGGELRMDDPEPAPEAVASFAADYGRVAAADIGTVFSLSGADLERMADDLVATGMFEREPCGDSWFIRASGGSCDPRTGVCSVRSGPREVPGALAPRMGAASVECAPAVADDAHGTGIEWAYPKKRDLNHIIFLKNVI